MRGKSLSQCIWLLSLQIIHPSISFEGRGIPRDLRHDPFNILAGVAIDHPIHPEATNNHLFRKQPRPGNSAQLEDGQRPPKRQRFSPDQLVATPIANVHEAFSRELDVGHHPRTLAPRTGALSHDVKGKHPAQESNLSGPDRSAPPPSTEGAEASHVQSALAHTGAERSSQPLTTIIQDLGKIPPFFPNVERIPYVPMPNKAVQKFTNDLKKSLTRYAALEDGAALIDVKEIDHLPADMVTYSRKPGKRRPGKRGQENKTTIIRVLDSEYNYFSPEKISSKLMGLFDYMVFNHALSSSHLGVNGVKRLKECAQILRWLKSQLEGTKDSLPVVGKVPKIRMSKGFGEVQRWIIWYLHHEDPRVYAYTTSIALLWSWYRAWEPEKLLQLEDKRLELGLESFWLLMRRYAAEPGPGAGWCKVKSFDEQTPLPSLLGQIGITSLHEMTRSYNQWAMKFANSPQEAKDWKIVAKIRQAYDGYMMGSQFGHPLESFHATSAVLQPCWNMIVSPEVVFMVRLTDISGRLITIPELEIGLKNLLESSYWWHQNLSRGLMVHGISPIPGAHELFLMWLTGILFKARHSLPVFGIVHRSTYNLFVGHPGFAQVQRFLIHHLSSNSSPGQPSTVASNAITLLAYWYSSQQADFWRQYIKDQRRVFIFIQAGLKEIFKL